MVAAEPMLMQMIRAIAIGDLATASRHLAESPGLARQHLERGATRQETTDYFLIEIRHYVYAGDTVLHIAAACYQRDLASALLSAGADVSAKNRRGAQPLHYAADGAPGAAHWNPLAQAATVNFLIEAGADPNAADGSGVAPLHRAVRNRCAGAVGALLSGGADPQLKNKAGSTPMKLAISNTGRGGTGSPESKVQQQEIVRQLQAHGGTL